MTPPDGPVRWLFRLGLREPRPGEAVDWEIEHYVDEEMERLVGLGREPGDARREARQRFGDGHRRRMAHLERRRRWRMNGRAAVDVVVSGLRGTLRTVRRSPGMALGIVLTLALGIGANAAIFQVVDRLLLRPPLHIEAPDQVVRFVLEWDGGQSQVTMTYPDVEDFSGASSFASVAKVGHIGEYIVGTGPEAAPARGQLASASFFPTLGVVPARGRFFGPDEDEVGVSLTVVLGHGYWQRAFGGDPEILGRTIRVDGEPSTVVGVAPDGFTGAGLEPVDLWLPMDPWHALGTGGETWRESRGWWWLTGVARLGDGVTREAASAEVTAIFRNARADDPDPSLQQQARIGLSGLTAGNDGGTPAETRVALWLLGVSVAVLLIACANVANLLLARGARARSETAVRLALGVSRRRLVGETIFQTVLLALVGGIVAVLVASWTGGLVQRTLLPEILFPETGVALRVLLFAVGASLVAGLLAGMGPALQGSRARVAEDLKAGRRGSSGRSRVGTGLAVFQGALAVILLVGAGLFLRSLGAVRGLDLGMEVDRIALVGMEPASTLSVQADRTELYEMGIERVRSLPGVESAALTTAPLFWSFAQRIRIPEMDSIPRLAGGGPYYFGVTPGYFATVGQRIERGRGFQAADVEGATPVAVVNRLMADSLWGGDAALGQCLLLGEDDAPPCTQVVGIAENATRGGFEDEPFFAYYLPLAQSEVSPQGIYLRSADPGALVRPVAELLRAESAVRWATVTPLRDALDPLARSWRMGATMFTVFGILALTVASIGLYSLLAFQVAQRTREIGIRAALGAERGRILRQVVGEGARIAALGIGLGLALALLVGPMAGDLLFEVSPRDPVTLTGVAAVLLLVALVASAVPGLRATRVEPSEALRNE